MAYGIPDIVGSYVKGRELGEQKAEQRKRKPYIEQLNQLALQKEEQSVELGKKQLTLQDYAIQQQQEKQKRALYKDMGQAAQWADTPDKWEQALDVYEQQGVDVQGFRGRYDLREATAGLNNPDFAAQQKAAQNLEKLVKTFPDDKQEGIRALSLTDPKKVAELAAKRYEGKDDQKGRFKEFNDTFVLDSATGKITAPSIGKGVEPTKPLAIKDVQGINKDITSLTKNTKEIVQAGKDLQALKARGTPAAQLAAVFKFMKALDPTSVVRESEQGMVYAAQGPAEALAGKINGLLGEGKLTEAAFSDVVDTSVDLANKTVSATSIELDNFLNTYDLTDEQREKFDARIPIEIKIAAATKATPGSADRPAAPQAALDRLAANPSLIGDFEKMYGYRPEGY